MGLIERGFCSYALSAPGRMPTYPSKVGMGLTEKGYVAMR